MRPAQQCRERYRDWKQPKPHPVTGDLLKPGERVTWSIMGVYRRWSVFLLLQALTVTWWCFPNLFPGGLFGWNVLWSDLAVVVEMLVGIAFLNQSMRDARVIREELKQSHETDARLREEIAQVQEDARLIREIHAALVPGGDTALVAGLSDAGQRTLEIRDRA